VFVILDDFPDSIQSGESRECAVSDRQVDFSHPAIDGILNSVCHLFRNDPNHVMFGCLSCHFATPFVKRVIAGRQGYDQD
jgi:hypothetical protein